ncbi:DEAD/DEAH box helicase [Nocardia salmonicida]|uniref:DEAD/DEAH box helicase n=1 Tax=Nocardia salmonicida TaxID=53431 RepID=UPI0037970325
MRSGLTERIVTILRAQPNLSAPQIVACLAEPGVDRSVVNRVLYAEWSRFVVDASANPPRWSLKGSPRPTFPTPPEPAAAREPTVPPPSNVPATGAPPLRNWQQRTLALWIDKGRKGVVEAVDGTGKTVLGVRAVLDAVAAGTPAVVVVADDQACTRWLSELAAVAPDRRVVGPNTSSRPGTPRTWQVAIVTPATVPRLRQIAPATQCSDALLVIDDIDRYSEGMFAQVLTDQFATRLALTRALDHGDQTVRAKLLPYFGPVLAGCDYATARADGVLEPITLVHVAVDLDPKERAALDRAQALVDRQYDTLVGTYGAPESPTEFRLFVDALAVGRGSGAHHANRYLAAVADRGTALAESSAKLDLVRALPADLLAATQSVIFADRPVAAAQIYRVLAANGVAAATTSPTLTAQQRATIADGLSDKSISVLVEQRILDPTLTIPGAEIALLLARTRDSTQLVHRLSRIIRPGRSSRRRLVVVAFVAGSAEDPSRDDAGTTAVIRSLAAEIVRTDPAGLVEFLREWHSTATTSARSEKEPIAPGPSAEPDSELDEYVVDHRFVTDPDDADDLIDLDDDSAIDTYSLLADMLSELTTLGNIGTSEELGDLIGCCDPAELRELVDDAARAEHLVFHEIGGDSEDLLVLTTTGTDDRRHTRAAAERIAVWAADSEDPIGGMHALIADLDGMRVPPYRLVQIAAFLRGKTPKALL